MVNLTNLYYFKVAAEKQNLTKAADALFISQPALSMAIAKLEQELGVKLFERERGRIYLSQFGKAYYASVERAFRILARGEKELHEMQRQTDSVASVVTTIGGFLDPMITDYISRCPTDMRINQNLISQETFPVAILDKVADFGITPVHCMNPDLEQTVLAEDEVFLVVGRDHPLAGKQTVFMKDLQDEKLLINESYFDQFIVTHCCVECGFLPNIHMFTNESGALLRALEDGIGVSLVPASVLFSLWFDHLEELRIIRFQDIRILRMISIARRKNATLSPQVQKLYSFAEQYYRELGKDTAAFFERKLPLEEDTQRRVLSLIERPLDEFDDMSTGPSAGLGEAGIALRNEAHQRMMAGRG